MVKYVFAYGAVTAHFINQEYNSFSSVDIIS